MSHISKDKPNIKVVAAVVGVIVVLVVPIWVVQLKLNMQDIATRRISSSGLKEEMRGAKDELKKLFVPLPKPTVQATASVQAEAVKNIAEKLKNGTE